MRLFVLGGLDREESEMKVVINKCYGGFSVSEECAKRMAELGHEEAKREVGRGDRSWYGYICTDDIERADPILVQVIEEIGSERASGSCASLEIVNIPDGVDFEICSYDGLEHIAEKHRTWY